MDKATDKSIRRQVTKKITTAGLRGFMRVKAEVKEMYIAREAERERISIALRRPNGH